MDGRHVDAAQPVDLPDDTPLRTQHGMTTLGEAMKMTAPDPLREDEVEAVAEAMHDEACLYFAIPPEHREAMWQDDRKGWKASARAAILRLDQVREERGK